jgi:hypothetical protein
MSIIQPATYFIEVPVQSQEKWAVVYLCVRGIARTSERSFICVLGVSPEQVSGRVFVC